MSKRKRTDGLQNPSPRPFKQTRDDSRTDNVYIQIVTGSYERVLHGITATVPRALLQKQHHTSTHPEGVSPSETISFTDSFLLNAHTSAIKCLAISPPPPTSSTSQKLILATGSTDEKINLFHLSTLAPRGPVLPSLGSTIQENVGNRSLGTLHTHNAPVTALHFPNRSKLLSSCGNNVIAVTSTRTFSTLSLMKAPNPKHPNRPTGDTSTTSTLPNGINDFAVHPSMKLMISVGRAERNMRLWNLVTGKKAGVLSFDRELLAAIGESNTRWGSGEGHKILWSPAGSEFAICFQRGICIFGTNCEPIAIIAPSPSTKIHQARYLPDSTAQTLALSTEDGRVLFYSSTALHAQAPLSNGDQKVKSATSIPKCILLGQLGGKHEGMQGRIKDFHVLQVDAAEAEDTYLVSTAGSDGSIRVWRLDAEDLATPHTNGSSQKQAKPVANGGNSPTLQVGTLIGTYETSNRITCIISFQLSAQGGDAQQSALESAEDDHSGASEDKGVFDDSAKSDSSSDSSQASDN